MSGGGQTMSPDAIAALVEAAKEGRLPEESRNEPRRQRRMRTVDFTRPTKFTADQERRIKRALDTFSRTASGRLSAELRMPLELEVINVSQLTWSNAHAQVPSNSIAAMIETRPVLARMLLTAEVGLVLHAIELLLGGDTSIKPRDRRLTDIDWALGRHFIERLLAQLSAVWMDFAELELGLSSLDTHLDTAQMAPVSEPTLSLTMEARLDAVVLHHRPPAAVGVDRPGRRPLLEPRRLRRRLRRRSRRPDEGRRARGHGWSGPRSPRSSCRSRRSSPCDPVTSCASTRAPRTA